MPSEDDDKFHCIHNMTAVTCDEYCKRCGHHCHEHPANIPSSPDWETEKCNGYTEDCDCTGWTEVSFGIDAMREAVSDD